MIKQFIFVCSFILLVIAIPSENSCDPSSIPGCAFCTVAGVCTQCINQWINPITTTLGKGLCNCPTGSIRSAIDSCMDIALATSTWSTFQSKIDNTTVTDLYNNIYLAEYIGPTAVFVILDRIVDILTIQTLQESTSQQIAWILIVLAENKNATLFQNAFGLIYSTIMNSNTLPIFTYIEMFNSADAMLNQCTDIDAKKSIYSAGFEVGILDYIKRCDSWQSTPWKMTYGSQWIIPINNTLQNVTVGSITLTITTGLWNALQAIKTPTSTLFLSFYALNYGYNPFDLQETITLLTPIADINFYEKQTTGYVNSVAINMQSNYQLQYAGYNLNSSASPVCALWTGMSWVTYGLAITTNTVYTCNANRTDYSTTPIAVAQNGSFHLSCGSGKYWEPQRQECIACMSHCSSCVNGTTCSNCASGYQWSSSQQACMEPQQCPSGQYFDAYYGECQFCMKYCGACTSRTSCTVCDSQTVWSAASSSCVSRCQSGQFFDYATHSCLSCQNGCTQCISSTGCCSVSGIFFN